MSLRKAATAFLLPVALQAAPVAAQEAQSVQLSDEDYITMDQYHEFLAEHNIRFIPQRMTAEGPVENSPMVLAFGDATGCVKYDQRMSDEDRIVYSMALVKHARAVERDIESGEIPDAAIPSANGIYIMDRQQGEVTVMLPTRAVLFNPEAACR